MGRSAWLGVLQIISGNAFRQGLIFASMLVVARLYEKEALGELTLFIAVVNIAQNIVFLKGEYRLITDPKRSDYIDGFLYSLIFMCISCVFLGLGFAISKGEMVSGLFYILCFLFVFFPALIEKALGRGRDYSQITKIRAGDGVFQSVTPVLLGLIKPQSEFLIAGRAFGFGFALMVFSQLRDFTARICLLAYRRFRRKGIYFDAFLRTASRNKYLIASGFVTSLSVNLPIIAIATFFTNEDLGVYGMVSRILGVPITLIGASLSTVFIAECNKVRRRNESGILKILYVFSGISFFLGVCVYFGCLHSSAMFGVLLGQEWGEAGEIASIMAIHFGMQMFVNPISTIAITLDETRAQSVFDLMRLFVLATVVLALQDFGLEVMLYVFSVASGVVYVAYYMFFWSRCKRYEKKL